MPKEIELRDSAMSGFFDLQPHAAFILDQAGRVLRANRAAAWMGENGQYPNFVQLTGVAIGGDVAGRAAPVSGWTRRVHVRAANGETRPMDVSLVAANSSAMAGEPALYYAILCDVSASVQRARSDMETESRSKASTHAVPVLIWMAAVDRHSDWFSDTWLAFRGRTLGEELGAGWAEGVHPDDLERCLGIYATCFEAHDPFSMDYRLKRHDGVYRWVLDTGIPRYRDDGTFLGYIGTCLDITERKDLEDRVAEYSRKLRLSDRRREDFLAKLSHQLRGPLAPIAHAAALLGRMEQGNPDLAKVRGIIERQVVQLQTLVTDLIDVTRIMKGKVVLRRERVDIDTLLDSAIDAVRPKFERRQQVVQRTPLESLRSADVDPHWLSQALAALLDNAVKFSPDRCAIQVSASMTSEQLVITIEDPGVGIDPEFLPKVFEPFMQGPQSKSSAEEALGVGLTLAKRIAELHGGSLVLESAGQGCGAKATLRLPTAASAGNAEGDDFELSSVTGRRVLIIEDNADSRESLRMLMERRGNDVMAAATAEQGLQIAELFTPEVVVCDIGLPDMDGFGAVQGLRAKLAGQDTRYVALTGYALAEVREHALESGFDTVLFKPLRPA